MIRPKRKAAPTVFIDNGIIPEDASHEDKSISNEDELLKETYSDVSGEDDSKESSGSADEVPTKITKKGVTKPVKESIKEPIKAATKKIVTTKPESTVKKPTKNNTNDVVEETEENEKPAKNIKPTRKFKLLPETIASQGSTPKINIKLEYETSTPIQCARQIAPIIYAANLTTQKSPSTFRYVFTVQEVTSLLNPKNFSYVSESTINLPPEGKGEVKHVVKPQTKITKNAGKAEKATKNTENVPSTITREKRESENRPVIEKKSVPTRTNVKKLTPAKKKGVKK
jgi:hypothetical protein